MRFLSLIRNNEVVAQVKTQLTDEECIELDEMLRNNGVYGEETELAITYDCAESVQKP